MKKTILLSLVITVCLLSQSFAQTYSPTYSTKIVLKNGNKLTILPPAFAADFSMTLPNANASGVLTNDGSGGLSWAAAGGAGWATNGNTLTGTLPGTPTEFFGSTNAADVIFKTGNAERLRMYSTGGINIPISASTGDGVIFQNGDRFIHSYGTNNFFAGSNAGNFTMTGIRNTASGSFALYFNTTGRYNTASGSSSLISNTTGEHNTASGNSSLISNTTGEHNTASGSYALINNATGSANTALGYLAGSINTTGTSNTFVGYYADAGADALTNATAIGNGAIVAASNTMRFGDGSVVGWGFAATPTAGVDAIRVGSNGTNGNGATLTVGGTWTNGSSRNFKERFTSLDGAEVLSKIRDLNVLGWYYKGTNEYHIGPIAEEFYAAFNTGNQSNPSQTEKYISSVDPAGIALVGIKELVKANEEQAARIKALEEKLEHLEKLLK